MTSGVHAARVAASWAAVDHLSAHGAGASVRDLAAAASISVRTFHRYFPRPEDLLRPAMQDAQNVIATAVTTQPDSAPLGEALMIGWTATAEGEHFRRTHGLLPVILENLQYMALWSQEISRHGTALQRAVAERLGQEAEDLEVEVTLTLFLSLVQRALLQMVRAGQDPLPLLEERVRAAGSSLLDSAPGTAGTT